MKIRKMHHFAIYAAALTFGSLAVANIQVTFDDASNPFSGGTISSAQSVSGSSSLFVAQGDNLSYSIPSEYQNKDIVITMQVFDQGQWATTGSQYGPRWGVGNGTGATNYVAASIIHKSFLPSNSGYGKHLTTKSDGFTASWFSPDFVTGSTRDATLSATSDDGSLGTGAWTEWYFEISSTGAVHWGKEGLVATDDNIGSTATTIYLRGGTSNSIFGMYVDDVTISLATVVPEPSTYAFILGLAGFALIAIRRRLKIA